MNNPRYWAAKILAESQQKQSYLHLALDAALKRAALTPTDARLCTALVYGVTERRRTLDYQLQPLLRKPLKQLPLWTLTVLRLGVFQLFYMDRIPSHAAIASSVDLIKAAPRAQHTAGLANAVLRRVQTSGLQLPQGHSNAALAVRYSVPKWLVALWKTAYPNDAMALLEHSLSAEPTITLRANPLRTSAAALAQTLFAEPHPQLPLALQIPTCNPQTLPGFAEGYFHVQDLGAQLCCEALNPQPGSTVLDLCAAPGGKSFTMTQMMQDRGRVLAVDLHPQRSALIAEGTKRLGLTSIECLTGDCTNDAFLQNLPKSHHILCDVPCSGLGILRKKPDIREKTAKELDILPEIQYAITRAAAQRLLPGGHLLYCTCTLHPAENEAVARRLLQDTPNLRAVPVLPHWDATRTPEGFATLLPHRLGCDGFFLAKFVRLED